MEIAKRNRDYDTQFYYTGKRGILHPFLEIFS